MKTHHNARSRFALTLLILTLSLSACIPSTPKLTTTTPATPQPSSIEFNEMFAENLFGPDTRPATPIPI